MMTKKELAGDRSGICLTETLHIRLEKKSVSQLPKLIGTAVDPDADASGPAALFHFGVETSLAYS